MFPARLLFNALIKTGRLDVIDADGHTYVFSGSANGKQAVIGLTA